MIHENLVLGFSPIANGNQERSNSPISMSLFFLMAFLNQVPHMNHNTEHDLSNYFLIYFPGVVYNKNHSECKKDKSKVKWKALSVLNYFMEGNMKTFAEVNSMLNRKQNKKRARDPESLLT